MKRATITLLLLLSICASAPLEREMISSLTSFATPASTLLSQPSPIAAISVSQPTTWEKEFDNQGNADIAWDIVETPSGDFVVVGATGPTPCQLGCNWDGWVIKMDSQGDLIWARQFGGNGADLLTAVTLKGNNYIATGSKYVFPYARQAWLLEIAPDGSLVREKTFGGSQDDSGADIIATPDDGFFLSGHTQSLGTQDGKSDVWLVKLNSNGDAVWTKTYDLGNEDMGTSMTLFQNDRFIITAVTCEAYCGGLIQQGFATCFVIDAGGNVLKTSTFAEGPKNKFMKITSTSDGGAVIAGATSMIEKFPSEDTWIVKLDANADISWTRIISSYGRYDGGLDIVQTSDGGYVVAAYSQVYQTPQMNFDNFWVLRLSSDGDTLWTGLWGGPENDDARSVIPTSDGEFVVAGFKNAVSWPLNAIPGPADFYVIKTAAAYNTRLFLPCVLKNSW